MKSSPMAVWKSKPLFSSSIQINKFTSLGTIQHPLQILITDAELLAKTDWDSANKQNRPSNLDLFEFLSVTPPLLKDISFFRNLNSPVITSLNSIHKRQWNLHRQRFTCLWLTCLRGKKNTSHRKVSVRTYPNLSLWGCYGLLKQMHVVSAVMTAQNYNIIPNILKGPWRLGNAHRRWRRYSCACHRWPSSKQPCTWPWVTWFLLQLQLRKARQHVKPCRVF